MEKAPASDADIRPLGSITSDTGVKGPFPRYIWIHQDTPQDSLDKACHEIWKRVQDLPDGLRPKVPREERERQSATAFALLENASAAGSGSGSYFNEE
ncbi:hypothetical protein NDU88_002265 [Pleurodeles waltl]|uniref:Uncharacterized protein n=1 Tax=Pleurodeles waltl TaxID=8319 RepID=A0AAV7TLB9_PLEWA|nr:hypothetical protein NDU88_002265 [Pleurodeles waltl]